MNKKYIIIPILTIILIAPLSYFILKKDLKEVYLDNMSSKQNTYIDESISKKDDNDFQIDLVLHKNNRDIHYSAYIPDNITKETEIPLYITLPGYEGLYFQGVGVNLKQEDFAYTAKEFNLNMIILAPQLEDWGNTSANDTIALIEYYKENFNISKVYANGYSGGGETLSLVMGKRADLIDGCLIVSSKWDGDYKSTIENKTPVYFFIGENDEYYSSKPTKEAYNTLYQMYKENGLNESEINEILILDIKDETYFKSHNAPNEHGGGGLAAYESSIMEWLLTR